MLRRELPPPTWRTRLQYRAIRDAGDLVGAVDGLIRKVGAITPDSRRSRVFGHLGPGSIIAWPVDSLVNPGSIHIGAGTVIAPHCVLSAGWMPDEPGLGDRVVVVGERCLLGRGSSLVGHRAITIGDDVWTGHGVHITDMNHGYEQLDVPIAEQWMDAEAVTIGDGAWLGHGTVVLPGARIGRHSVVGANSVVAGEIPDHSVAVGAPARVVRRHDPRRGWIRAGDGEDPGG